MKTWYKYHASLLEGLSTWVGVLGVVLEPVSKGTDGGLHFDGRSSGRVQPAQKQSPLMSVHLCPQPQIQTLSGPCIRLLRTVLLGLASHP